MPTIIVTNPLRALQLENQRLRRELDLLRQQHVGGGSQELAATSAPALPATALAAPRQLVQSTPVQGLATRVPAQPPAAGAAPRPMVHMVAADAPVTTSPRPSRTDAPPPSASRTEPEVLDDAAARFRLLELD